MDTDARGFPLGDLRVSDADRDRALSELSEALQVGRITSEEFDQRSGHVLAARTGKELAAPLADLPVTRPPAAPTALRRRVRRPVPRVVIGASVAAACFAAVSVTNAASQGTINHQREMAQEILARQGMSVTIPPAPPFDWPATLVPAALAVLLVLVAIAILRASRS